MGDEAMSAPIQRYEPTQVMSARGIELGMVSAADGRFMEYADHVRTVAEAVQAVIKAGEEEAYALAHIHSGDQQLAVRLILEAQRAAIRHDPATLSTNEKSSEAPRGGR